MERLKEITQLNEKAMEEAKIRWNRIAKPLHSLGILEDAVVQMAGINGNPDVRIGRRAVVVMCADHGVVAEGVTQSDSSVTAVVAAAMAKGDGNINSLAQTYHADVIPVDIGMLSSVPEDGVKNLKVACGTGNIAVGAAMTKAQGVEALQRGMDMVRLCREQGYDIIVTGEMGIGNTTPSSALAAVLLGEPIEAVTGRGAGLDRPGLERKYRVIQRAIRVNGLECLYQNQKKERKKLTPECMLDILCKLGGYDIAGMAGMFLGGAVYKVPVVIDGFISAIAALVAAGLCPAAKQYMLCAHVSKEPAGTRILDVLGFCPVIHAGLCLGEGTGGIMLLPLLDGALAIYRSAHSFDNLQIDQYKELLS